MSREELSGLGRQYTGEEARELNEALQLLAQAEVEHNAYIEKVELISVKADAMRHASLIRLMEN